MQRKVMKTCKYAIDASQKHSFVESVSCVSKNPTESQGNQGLIFFSLGLIFFSLSIIKHQREKSREASNAISQI